MTNYDVVTKLIGPVTPVGQADQDKKRLENLVAMCELVEKLVSDISDVAYDNDSPEYSVATAGHYAANFMKRIKEQ